MAASGLIRLTGFVAILGGALSIAVYSTGSLFILSEGEFSVATKSRGWLFLVILGLASTLPVLVGLIGIYARQMERSGYLGLIGFCVAFIGVVLWAGVSFMLAFVMPELTRVPLDLLDSNAVSIVFMPGVDIAVPLVSSAALLTTIFFSMVGWLLFAFATVRARVYSQWTALLLAVGGFTFVFPWIGWVVIGVALVWMGLSVWWDRGPASIEPARAA